MTSNDGQLPPGLVGSLRHLVAAVLGLVRNRLRILNVEIQEEKLRLAELLVMGVMFVLFLLMAFILIFITLILFLWEWAEWISLGFTIFFVLGAFVFYRIIYHRLTAGPSPFDETVSELKKDIVALIGRDE